MSHQQNKVSKELDKAVKKFNHEEPTEQSVQKVLDALVPSMMEDGTLFIPINIIKELKEKDIVEYQMFSLNFEGLEYFPAYTNQNLIPLDENFNYLESKTIDFLEDCVSFGEMGGIILNPWTNRFYLPMDTVKTLIKEINSEEC